MLFIATACAILATASTTVFAQSVDLPAYGAATYSLVSTQGPSMRPSACKSQVWGGFTYSSGAVMSTPSSSPLPTSQAPVGGAGGGYAPGSTIWTTSTWTTAPSPYAGAGTMVSPAEGGVVSAPAVSGGYAAPPAGNSTAMPTLGGYQPAPSSGSSSGYGGSGVMQATNAGPAIRPGAWMTTAAALIVAGAVALC